MGYPVVLLQGGFLYFVLIQTSLHEGDTWYHFVAIFTCLLLILYFICYNMGINLIWIETKLNWIDRDWYLRRKEYSICGEFAHLITVYDQRPAMTRFNLCVFLRLGFSV